MLCNTEHKERRRISRYTKPNTDETGRILEIETECIKLTETINSQMETINSLQRDIEKRDLVIESLEKSISEMLSVPELKRSPKEIKKKKKGEDQSQ